MEKSLQLIVGLAKLFHGATKVNSIPKAAACVEIQRETEQSLLGPGCPPKNSQGAWKLPFLGQFLGSFPTEPQV